VELNEPLEQCCSNKGRDRMLRKFFNYFGGMIVHPKSTLDELARKSSVRFAVLLALMGLFITPMNVLLFAAFGYDWLGTRRKLAKPTSIGFFG
jgi:hypothetical protein